MAHSANCNCGCRNSGFVQGYVDGGTRVIRPFDPNQPIIEEIVVVPPSSGNGGKIFIQYVATINNTSNDGDVITPETFSFLPIANSDIYISVNGLQIYPANGSVEVATSAFYITDSTGTITRSKGTYQIYDIFKWNGSIANYQISGTDDIKIIYEI